MVKSPVGNQQTILNTYPFKQREGTDVGHLDIKEVVNTMPAAPGMYVKVIDTEDLQDKYLLVVVWAEVRTASGNVVLGLTIEDLGLPHTHWPVIRNYTSQPDRNNGVIIR